MILIVRPSYEAQGQLNLPCLFPCGFAICQCLLPVLSRLFSLGCVRGTLRPRIWHGSCVFVSYLCSIGVAESEFGSKSVTFIVVHKGKSELNIDFAIFREGDLLCRGSLSCCASEETNHFHGTDGFEFEISARYEEPACPVEIVCRQNDEHRYDAALRVGVHTSDDWESISLGDIHILGFRCNELKL